MTLHVVSALKQEMLDSPCGDVIPILCIVKVDEDEVFNQTLKDSYQYITVARNHSREALQPILKENNNLEHNKLYSPMCSIQTQEHQLSKATCILAASFMHEAAPQPENSAGGFF